MSALSLTQIVLTTRDHVSLVMKRKEKNKEKNA